MLELLALACSSVIFSFFDQALELALGDLAGLLQALVDELLVDVLEDHRQVGGGQRLGDLAAHRAGADDRGLEYEHVLEPPRVDDSGWGRRKPIRPWFASGRFGHDERRVT